MKKRTTEKIQQKRKMNNEQQTIDTTSAKLLPIRLLHAVYCLASLSRSFIMSCVL